ncbi:ATP/GTP-binding protein [Kitasatospora sp. NPDC006697]|uniref:ATP/GTP-binding protein n=1 Tax=Kitasatospora sp. NPDC006697 TaxID=3364020 RepID=UPI0036BFD744
MPCYKEGVGWFNYTDQCYWDLLNPQPPADAPDWQWGSGAPSDPAARAKGKAYNVICPGIGRELAGGTSWSLNPPPGFGGGPSPEELAQEAIKKMRLLGAQIGTAPGNGTTGIVGMPVWIWNVKTDRTWGPVSASASAGGITVNATANVQKIVYTMGDGGGVTCTSAGTPYNASYGGSASPDCGYRYTKTSSAFSVGAVTTWTVHWEGGGQQGDITTTRASGGVNLAIGEAQVVAKP